jgi:hypothetical protein
MVALVFYVLCIVMLSFRKMPYFGIYPGSTLRIFSRDELEVDSRLRGNDNVCFEKFNLLKNFKYFILIKTPFLPCDKLLL